MLTVLGDDLMEQAQQWKKWREKNQQQTVPGHNSFLGFWEAIYRNASQRQGQWGTHGRRKEQKRKTWIELVQYSRCWVIVIFNQHSFNSRGINRCLLWLLSRTKPILPCLQFLAVSHPSLDHCICTRSHPPSHTIAGIDKHRCCWSLSSCLSHSLTLTV